MHPALHDPRATSTPLQRLAFADHQRRLERIRAAAEAPRTPPLRPEPPATLAPIPRAAFAEALAMAAAAEAWERAAASQPEPTPLVLNTVEPIQRAVVAAFPDVTLTDIKSARRTAVVVRPRQIAMYLAKELTTRSLPEIGRRFGNRDHTTVLHAVRKISALVKSDPDICAVVDQIKTSLAEARI